MQIWSQFSFQVYLLFLLLFYSQADVGMGRNNGQFLYDKFNAIPLDAIDENKSLQLAATAAAPPANGTSPTRQPGQQQQHHRAANTTPLARVSSESGTSKVPQNWTKGELIGQGAFGSVYLGMDNDTGQLIAVKQVSLGQRTGPQGAAKLAEHVRSLEAEVQLLQDLNHPNIVRYLGTQRTQDALNIFLEYVPGGSIASLLAKFGSFQESVVRVYTKQILQGLVYLHGQGVIHRDIKGANILVANTGLVKLADFGASKKIEGLATMESGFKSVKGTPYWMAPEVITATGHGKQADIWSVACTVIEMATGKPPWTEFGSQVAAMFHIAKSKGPPKIPEHLSPECKDFLYLCFNRNWKERPTAETLLRHAFLKDVVDVVTSESSDAVNVGVSGSGGVVSGDLTQIPAYRASGGSAAATTRAGRQGSPPKPASGNTNTSNNNNNSTGMSPLGNHLSTSRGNGLAGISGAAGPRRQLNLDAAGAAGGTGSVSPSKRPSALMSSAPVFANIRDSTGVGPPNAALIDGRLTRPTTTPHGGAGRKEPAAGRSGPRTSSQGKDTLPSFVVPDPATLGALRRSGSASLEILSQNEVAETAPNASTHQDPGFPTGNSNLMATIALSSGINCTTTEGNGSEGQHSLQCSLASTAQQESATSSAGSGNTIAQEESTSVDQTVRPHSATGSGNSQNSKKSEFNPMEEPAWMAAAAAAAGGGAGAAAAGMKINNSLGNSSNGSDLSMPRTRAGSPSDGEATSIHPLPSSNNITTAGDRAMMPPPPPLASKDYRQQLRSSGSGRFLRTSSSSSHGEGNSNSSTGTANTNTTSTSAVQPSGTAASASEGPVVYTVEADLDGAGPGGLPWDMPESNTIATATATVSGGGGGGLDSTSSELLGKSASLRRWGRPAEGPSSCTTSLGGGGSSSMSGRMVQQPQISSAAASAATPATTSSSSGGAVDQDVILNALKQCAQRDLRASLALFNEAHRRISSGSSSLNSKSSEDSGGVKNSRPTAAAAPFIVEDPTEVTSPARHRVSVHQSRIPRAPSESPIAKQRQQTVVNVNNASAAGAATPRRSSHQHHAYSSATPTKMGSLGGHTQVPMMSMTPSRSGALASAVTPSKSIARRSSATPAAAVPQSPRATPSKQLRAAAYSSPGKRQYSASVGGGSYEQQLRARQGAAVNSAGASGTGGGNGGGGGDGYAARAAAGTPAKSANTHPLRTPRREGGGSRPGSAAMTPQRRASALP